MEGDRVSDMETEKTVHQVEDKIKIDSGSNLVGINDRYRVTSSSNKGTSAAVYQKTSTVEIENVELGTLW